MTKIEKRNLYKKKKKMHGGLSIFFAGHLIFCIFAGVEGKARS